MGPFPTHGAHCIWRLGLPNLTQERLEAQSCQTMAENIYQIEHTVYLSVAGGISNQNEQGHKLYDERKYLLISFADCEANDK